MTAFRIRFTRHALDAMERRAIPAEWVEKTISAPDAIEPDPAGGGLLRAWRALPEAGGRSLRVVHRHEDPDIVVVVVTVFLDRGRESR
ncbi:hypothetical protein HVIM_03232 [Roseomonas mucosa]|uniref:DUF4258 domain-containing protein n=2 Tax=Roseomonas mucosa TaxID=207340 RepID=A0A379N5U6_9PROT|nr:MULTISPECIES: DUF4258 domain-containing protein [Roseomonas]MCG7352664.1 DUF4258 domain-containing protein [Roseomonas mucosa]MCG7358205.1 DUF4258 domain-containing protein [Roseomonas mucosa]MDT8291586.1 DUF4258 domain-containing protein [Roseomonas mucosa]MDT8295525.1 DUF4258 domain-containing protein [Roseomonas mucosa]MDT8315992.1 DUF4258 domain-containing protein [Roseomonas mucosa]